MTWEGEGEFRQTGHVPFILSHSSMQSAWKQCLQWGIHLIASLQRYSDKQMGQGVSLGPGTRLLSPRISLSYDSMVRSSRPVIRMVDCGCGDTVAVVELRPRRRPLQFMTRRYIAIPVAHETAGSAVDRQMILNTRKALFDCPANSNKY